MKPLYIKIACSILIAGLIFSGCSVENKEVRLTYKFETGKKYHYTYDSHSLYKAFENDKLVYTGDSTFKVLYAMEAVELIDRSKARLHFDYTAYYGRNKSDSWSTEYIMSNNGEITGIFDDEQNGDELLEYYNKLFEQTAPSYPDEPVKKDFSWKHTVKVLLDEGKTDASTTYKVKSFVRDAGYDCAVIEYSGNMILPLPSDNFGDDGLTKGADNVAVNGVVYFAYKEGIVIKEEETSHLVREGTVTIGDESTSFRIEENRTYSSILTRIE